MKETTCNCFRSKQRAFALKIISKSKCKGKEQMIENEVSILRRVKHINIISLIEEFDTNEELYLVMELVRVSFPCLRSHFFMLITLQSSVLSVRTSAQMWKFLRKVSVLGDTNFCGVYRTLPPDSFAGGRPVRRHHLSDKIHRKRCQRNVVQSHQCDQLSTFLEHRAQGHQARKPFGKLTAAYFGTPSLKALQSLPN